MDLPAMAMLKAKGQETGDRRQETGDRRQETLSHIRNGHRCQTNRVLTLCRLNRLNRFSRLHFINLASKSFMASAQTV